MEILDLDALEEEKEIIKAFTLLYIFQEISNRDLITLKVFIGLIDPLPTPLQRIFPPLTLAIVRTQNNSTDLSFLVQVCMTMDEIKRIFTYEDQVDLCKRITRRLKYRKI